MFIINIFFFLLHSFIIFLYTSYIVFSIVYTGEDKGWPQLCNNVGEQVGGID